MVNRDRFMLDCDSEGFTEPKPYSDAPFAALNIGRHPDLQMAQSLLADAKCLQCPPTEQCSRSGYCEQRNPEGWREIDGVKLPEITWAELDHDLAQMHLTAANNMDGITRLSDSYAPDAYYGWKK